MTLSLRSVFSAVVYKELAQVDLPGGSHQHEINGVEALKDFFTTSEKISGIIHWHYFSDNKEPTSSSGNFSFYDAREKSADRTGRSEWRMYYQGDFLSNAEQGDILILAKSQDHEIYGLVFQANSAWLRSAQTLFGFEEINTQLQNLGNEKLDNQELALVRQQILEELGIEISIPALPADEDVAQKELDSALKDGKSFPTTQRMSELARSLVQVDIVNGDQTLVRWLNKEEELFRAIETIIVKKKLEIGFTSVDDFINYSLSIQNRRKSRMGIALQNHLGQLFTLRGLKYEAQRTTEGKNKPDFLFPGQREYLDQQFNTELLIMLGVKSSCKERWRQILTEANRIKRKHLCTLEQSISIDQTREMKSQNVRLILPAIFHPTYTPDQQKEIWTVDQFIDYVRSKQKNLYF